MTELQRAVSPEEPAGPDDSVTMDDEDPTLDAGAETLDVLVVPLADVDTPLLALPPSDGSHFPCVHAKPALQVPFR